MSTNGAAVQAVFDKVIDAGFYPDDWYMCWALTSAHHDGVITGEEWTIARVAIRGYLDDCPGASVSVLHALKVACIEDPDMEPEVWAHSEGVHFYRNWADRPELG